MIPTIEIDRVVKRFGHHTAVDDVSFTVPPACVFALLGENGAGKTTLIRMLLGLLTPDSGRLSVFGLASDRYGEQIRQRVGYALAADQVVGHVAPPFDPIRMEFYRLGNPSQAEAIPMGPSAMTFRWNGDKLTNWGMTFSGPQGGYSLTGLLDALIELMPQEIEGPADLLKKPLPGDWIIRTEADRVLVLKQLETILRDSFDLNVRLEFRSVERQVYVARGNYRFTPLQNQAEEPTEGSNSSIQIFAGDTLPANTGGGGGSGDLDTFLKWLGRFIDNPVVGELENKPTQQVSWRQRRRSPFTEQMQREDHDPEAVLRNIAAQTGLRFAKEARTVEILFIEER